MLTRILTALLLMSFVSCSTYKIAEGHLNRKMKRADLQLHLDTLATGAQVEYWDSKDTSKPALLLVHGFGATTKYQWYKQVKLLSKKYRVVAPNLNYFGKTIPDTADYTVGGQVQLLEDLLDHLQLEELTLMGVSYGGLVSIEMLHQTERSVSAMVLFDTPVKFSDSADVEAVKEYFDTPTIEELFVPSEPVGLNKLLYLATGEDRKIPESFLKDFHENAYAYNLEDKRKLITGLLGQMEEFKERTYSVSIPTLLIWGTEDKVVPLRTGEQLAEYLGSTTKLKKIEGAAHMPNMTHTKEFNILIEVFLEIRDL